MESNLEKINEGVDIDEDDFDSETERIEKEKK